MFNGDCNLSTVWLWSTDTSKAGEFYENVLGMKRIPHSGVDSFDGGGLRLSIHQAPEGQKVPSGECFIVFYVREGIDEKYRELRRRGVKFEGGIDEDPYGKTAGFRDPDGHQIFIWQPPPKDSTSFEHVAGIVEHYENVLRKLGLTNP